MVWGREVTRGVVRSAHKSRKRSIFCHRRRNLILSPVFFSLGEDYLALYILGSSRTESNLQHYSWPGSSYRWHPPNSFRSGRSQPPKRERLMFPANLRGARARRTHRQKGADPPTSTRSFVSRRHKSGGDPRSRTGFQCGHFIVRERVQRPVMKVYLSI